MPGYTSAGLVGGVAPGLPSEVCASAHTVRAGALGTTLAAQAQRWRLAVPRGGARGRSAAVPRRGELSAVGPRAPLAAGADGPEAVPACPSPSRHHVQETEAEDQRGAGAAARGELSPTAGTARRGRWEGSCLPDLVAAVAAFHRRHGRASPGEALVPCGSAGPAPPPQPREGRVAQAWPSQDSGWQESLPASLSARAGFARTSSSKFVFTDPPPARNRASVCPLYKSCLVGECKNLNIEQRETEMGFFLSV